MSNDLKGGFRLLQREVHARLLTGSHETFPIIWIGKPAPVIVLEKVRDLKIDSNEQEGGSGSWPSLGSSLVTRQSRFIFYLNTPFLCFDGANSNRIAFSAVCITTSIYWRSHHSGLSGFPVVPTFQSF